SAAAIRAEKLKKSLSGLYSGRMRSMLATSELNNNEPRKGTPNINFRGPALLKDGEQGQLGDYLKARNSKVGLAGGEGGGGGTGSGLGYGRVDGGSGTSLGGGGGGYVSMGSDEDAIASSVSEGLTRREVWEVIKRHWSEVRYCYENAVL